MGKPKKLNPAQMFAYNRFKIPGCANMYKCPIVDSHTGWRTSKNNTMVHELKKFEIAREIWVNGGLCVMETEEIGSKPRRIIDVVEFLPDGRVIKWEFETKFDAAVKKMNDPEVKIVPVGNWSDKHLEKWAVLKQQAKQGVS